MSHYRLIIAPLADDVPAIVRIRRALKGMLRVHRIRCVEIVEIDPPTPQKKRRRGELFRADAYQKDEANERE